MTILNIRKISEVIRKLKTAKKKSHPKLRMINPPRRYNVCVCTYKNKVQPISFIVDKSLHHERFAAAALVLCHHSHSQQAIYIYSCRNFGTKRDLSHLLIFGFLNTNRLARLSSCQSISVPIMLNKALLSIKILTPSCSTTSSNGAGLSTYSRW